MYILIEDGKAVTGVLADWDAVLEIFVQAQENMDQHHSKPSHEEFLQYVGKFDIVEFGEVRVMTEWEGKDSNCAKLKELVKGD